MILYPYVAYDSIDIIEYTHVLTEMFVNNRSDHMITM